MPWLKTWAPIIGAVVLIGATLLRLLGQGEAAAALEGFSGAVGLTQQSPVGAEEAGQAVGQLFAVAVQAMAAWSVARGVIRKVLKKARELRAGAGAGS